MKVKGWKSKLNYRKEIKFTTQQALFVGPSTTGAISSFLTNSLGTTIWGNNILDPTGVGYLAFPQQGTGNGQIDGTKYNSLYAEVIFDIVKTSSNANLYEEGFRLMVIKKRDPNVPFTGAAVYTFQAYNGPLNSKNYDVQFDKAYFWTTGSATNPVAGTNSLQSLFPKRKRFRFIIPLKKTMTLQAVSAAGAFPLPIYIIAVAINSDTSVVVTSIVTTYFFRDP